MVLDISLIKFTIFSINLSSNSLTYQKEKLIIVLMIILNERCVVMENVTANSMKLKQINVELVKSALKSEKYSTKNSIASITGLSVATCGNILKELLLTGEALELDLNSSTGGRPARRFIYNDNFSHVAAIYARKEGTYNTLVCIVSNMIGVQVYETSMEYDEITINEFECMVETLISLYPTIKALGIGIPGVVNHGIIGLCDFKELCNIPIEQHLSKKYNLLVVAENDVNSSAFGYQYKNEDEATRNLAYIYYPVNGNPGAGIIIDGSILRGNSNFAGEISFLPLGVNLEEQRVIQKNPLSFSDLVSKTIASINCIINTKKVVLSGYVFTEELLWSINNSLANLTPHGHIPEIIYEEEINDSYIAGLTYMALEKLSCNIQITIKK